MINISLTVRGKVCSREEGIYINYSVTRLTQQQINSSAKRKERLYAKNLRINRFVDLLRRLPCNIVRVVGSLPSLLILLLG